MSTASFSMSGLHRLDAEQSEFLQSLGLEVAEVHTKAQLQDLVKRAQIEVDQMSNTFVKDLSRDMLAELRQTHGV